MTDAERMDEALKLQAQINQKYEAAAEKLNRLAAQNMFSEECVVANEELMELEERKRNVEALIESLIPRLPKDADG